jgi:phosphatidylglycerophosphate synthase
LTQNNNQDERAKKIEHKNGLNIFVKLFAYRPIAIWMVKHIFLKLRISPNQLTYFEMILAVISMSMIGTGIHRLMIIGTLLGPICVLLDYLDGTLARARGIDSEYGRKIDAANNHLDNILMPMAATSGLFLQTDNKIVLFIGALTVFNTFMFTAGIKSVSDDGQIEYLYGKTKEKLNKVQLFLLRKTGTNIGLHTIFQYDTMFFIFWMSCILNELEYALYYFLAQSIFRVLFMIYEYKRKYLKGEK